MKKLFNKNTKFKVLTTLLVLVVMVACVHVKSNVKATSYVYDYWKNIIPSSEGITYKETYYNSDIKDINDANTSLPVFNNLTDMEVYEDTIYVLDYSTQSFTLPTGKVDKFSLGTVYIINQDFKYTNIINEFVISDEVKAKFDDYYHFSTPLEKITVAQATSSEFVDIYDGVKEQQTVANSQANFFSFLYAEAGELVLYDAQDAENPVIIDSSEYTVAVGKALNNDGKEVDATIVKFNGGAYTNVLAKYVWLDTPGRAPYLPYSQDATKAAVRLVEPYMIRIESASTFGN